MYTQNINGQLQLNSMTEEPNFITSTHKYNFNGHTFDTSVTSFVHSHFPPFNKKEAIRNILKSKKMQDSEYEYYGMDAKAIEQYWIDGANQGTALHEKIEHYYMNGRIPDLNDTRVEYGYFLNFASDFPNLQVFKSEMRIYSMELDLAGSIDLLVKNDDDTYSIIDWKRAKKMDTSQEPNIFSTYCKVRELNYILSTTYNHYCFQLNVYKYILEKYYGIIIKNMSLVVLHPNNVSNNYEIYEVPKLDREMNIIMQIRKQSILRRNEILNNAKLLNKNKTK